MLGSSLIYALMLMAVVSLLIYKINMQMLGGGQLALTIWLGAGVPVFAITFALMAAMMQPPQTYIALAALLGVGNGMLGLGLKMLMERHATRAK